jgi:hypothetical protein
MSEPVETLPAPEVEWPPKPQTKWEREYWAFRRLLPGLLATHRGQYVAVHNEQVVDSGPDRLELVMRVLKRVGNVDIHVGLVTDEPEPIVRIPHYRVVRTHEDAP